MRFELRLFVLAVWFFAGVSFGPIARADISPAERATAEALFQRGVTLMEEGSLDQACATFTATLELEKGVGTMLRLADCYDRQGKTASAWALFKEIAASAGLANDVVRQDIANERAKELESRLSLVKLTVPALVPLSANPSETTALVRVELAGAFVPKAMWDTAFPVDPGAQPIEVRATGYATWTSRLEIPNGPALMSVIVPALAPETPPPVIDAFATRHAAQTGSAEQTKSPQQAKKKPTPTSVPNTPQSSNYRQLGYAIAIIGAIGLGTSAYLAYHAHELNETSRASCQPDDPNACTPRGVDLRTEAQWFADAATVVSVSGGVMIAAGVSVVLFAPSSTDPAIQRGTAPLSVGLLGVW